MDENHLLYYIPNRDRKKTILHIPESHNLHICPLACGRRNAIRALQNREKDQHSFLYITEEDAISGEYVENIGAAVEELLALLEPTPRAIILHFNCIDDFLGTDEKALLRQLGLRFPSLRFIVCRVNPIAADEGVSQGMRKHQQMYGLLEYTGKKDDGINMIGNYVPIDENSELFPVLTGWGIHRVRQLFSCRTFEEYQALADSRLNLVLMPMGKLAAQDMAERLDIPWHFNPPAYDMNEVLENYRNLANILGKSCPDFHHEIAETALTIKTAREKAGSIPVIVDSSASMRPFALAKALDGYGFCVAAVLAPHAPKDDLEDREWLKYHCPQIKVVQREGVKAISGYGWSREYIAIGHDCAFILKANHFVDIFNDESFYGFHGIRKLMGMISKASGTKILWKST